MRWLRIKIRVPNMGNGGRGQGFARKGSGSQVSGKRGVGVTAGYQMPIMSFEPSVVNSATPDHAASQSRMEM